VMSLRWLRPNVSSQFQSRSLHLDLASGAVEEGARVSKVQSVNRNTEITLP
jgi:hypothetical protein